MTRPYPKPTALQVRLIVALLETGSVADAARREGLTAGAASGQLSRARERVGCRSNEQLVAVGLRDGWLKVGRMA